MAKDTHAFLEPGNDDEVAVNLERMAGRSKASEVEGQQFSRLRRIADVKQAQPIMFQLPVVHKQKVAVCRWTGIVAWPCPLWRPRIRSSPSQG